MAEQSFKNHSRYVPLFHFGAFSLLLAALVINSIYFFKALGAGSGRLQAAGILCLTLAAGLALWFARAFALRAQDRAIRAEENFRHYILTGKPFDGRLRMRHIIALRFASDAEFVELAKKAAEENLSSKEIKAAIKNWRADFNRV